MGGPLERVNNIRAAVGSLGELSSISGFFVFVLIQMEPQIYLCYCLT